MRCRRPVPGSLPYRPLMWEGSEVTASRINVARVMKIVLASMICTRSAVQLACQQAIRTGSAPGRPRGTRGSQGNDKRAQRNLGTEESEPREASAAAG